jgi:RHS repeat-associated protein
LRRYGYGYDTAGNRTSEQIDLGVSTATHNNLNQLTSLAASAAPVKFVGRLGEAGTVEVAGSAATMGIQNTSFVGYATASLGTSLVSISATDYATNSTTNVYQIVITNAGIARTLSYDVNGNLTNVVSAIGTNRYEWDGADRLIRITQLLSTGPRLVSEFTYDGLGRRVKILEKTNNVAKSTNWFVWCETELCEERGPSGSTVTKRFFGEGEQISGTNYFFLTDHLGSVREMTDTNQTVSARYEFDPYGRRTKVSGSLEADFVFTGHYCHQASGLLLAPYRAYDAETGRWISRDPIEERDGLNLYGYVGGDPIGWIDSLGANRVRIKLPNGYSGSVDQWNTAAGPNFEIHIKDSRGNEVAIVKSNGGYHETHGKKILKRPSELPADVKRAIRVEVDRRHASIIRPTSRASGLVIVGALAIVLTAEASAAEMVETLKIIAQECQNGHDNWAYVGLLTLRHELNQQAAGAGDIAMRQMLKAMK